MEFGRWLVLASGSLGCKILGSLRDGNSQNLGFRGLLCLHESWDARIIFFKVEVMKCRIFRTRP